MFSRDEPDFHVISVSQPPEGMLEDIRALLQQSQLGMDDDIEQFVVACSGRRLVGCAGLVSNTIKCVAVAADWRGENLSARLLGEVENLAVSGGKFHLFLYTRPSNLQRFRGCGFYPLVQWDDVAVLMENTPVGISQYCRGLQRHYHHGQRIGAVVMNANPFTLGHRFLAEQAAATCDWLHVFVVSEDVSYFPFQERLAMVRLGVADLPNVTVHAGSEYLISRATFPGYFLKDAGLVNQAWSVMDLLIFRQYIAPALGITHRFVGSEPFCPVTHQYNCDMHDWLEAPDRLASPPLKVVELPRKRHASGRAISASEVRALLRAHQLPRIRDIVPPGTYSHLEQHYSATAPAEPVHDDVHIISPSLC
ncbi:[citrate (pro-3S)-lyase] ligase [Rahnella aquatilis]|uniref:[Citrate [pro-3S]-lyase] ligase n=1 Tax=Rahnella aquatilis (strain ATCC 33071 / DSM 4594 / JCM 1683 / NBRC 105701 / NCIMB 13365 / CIP 78.65) TaxID=745277 RepID=H2IT20_RAHAC|nr:[citrate (pro-3S)-lyase] ligase [Rahnella aquatilis]AEX51539.1 (citrate (pro-3S)-lyase) ligase [Rahnella aquatilis CIP 78.65 = ATCC 33071]KFD16999.1 citrate lyase ligase [Rahnella aquatilis CIP 78.65 = ATCC 33071]